MGASAQIASEEELVACFRRIDRRDVLLGEDVRFPLALARVVTWSYGNRTFLVLRQRDTDAPLGVVFRRTAVDAARSQSMCAWCQRSRARSEVLLLSARVTARRTVGQYLCRDLSCFSLGDATGFEPPDAAVHRVRRALGHMHELVERLLRREA